MDSGTTIRKTFKDLKEFGVFRTYFKGWEYYKARAILPNYAEEDIRITGGLWDQMSQREHFIENSVLPEYQALDRDMDQLIWEETRNQVALDKIKQGVLSKTIRRNFKSG